VCLDSFENIFTCPDMTSGQIVDGFQEVFVKTMTGELLLDEVVKFRFRKKQPYFNAVSMIDCIKAHDLGLKRQMRGHGGMAMHTTVACEGDEPVLGIVVNALDFLPKILVFVRRLRFINNENRSLLGVPNVGQPVSPIQGFTWCPPTDMGYDSLRFELAHVGMEELG
jgi:hypothetical protein